MKPQVGRVLGGLTGLLLVLLVWPSPIDPLAFTPARKPGPVVGYAPNRELQKARRIAMGRVKGPEDVAPDEKEAVVYTGTADGKIVRVSLLNDTVADFAVTGGRPLGLRFDPQGRLIVCDSRKGLLAVDREGRVSTLATEAGGKPFRFTDNLDIARDGTVYFTDSSDHHGPDDYLLDLLEARPRGRLLRFDPATGQTSVLQEGLFFANGVALAEDESYLVVAECYRYRLTRYWLQGPKAGTTEVMADNLPGFPDNLSRGEGGVFWVAFFTVRNDLLDRLHPYPFAKQFLAKLPRILWPKPARYGFVAALDGSGRPVRSLHDPEGKQVYQVTSAREQGGILYLGTLDQPWLARYTLRSSFAPLRTKALP